MAPTETKDPVAFLSRVEPAPGTKSDRRLPPCRYFLSRWLLLSFLSLSSLSLPYLLPPAPLPQGPSLLPPSGPQLPPRCGWGWRAAARARPRRGHRPGWLGPVGAPPTRWRRRRGSAPRLGPCGGNNSARRGLLGTAGAVASAGPRHSQAPAAGTSSAWRGRLPAGSAWVRAPAKPSRWQQLCSVAPAGMAPPDPGGRRCCSCFFCQICICERINL